MNKNRLEAFSDGVLAVIITVMVLSLKIPHESTLVALAPLWPVGLSYLLSFLYIGIYWNNHHHMFKAVKEVNGPVMWSNLHLLFWLSLLPFTTAWMGENHFAKIPVIFYGIDLFLSSLAYFLLQSSLIKLHGKKSVLAKAVGRDFKGKASPLFYIAGIISALGGSPIIGFTIFTLVALMWLLPDRRVEKTLKNFAEVKISAETLKAPPASFKQTERSDQDKD